jgi:TonB family protein
MIAQLIAGRLLESSPRHGRGARSAAVASTATHVGLVALAVWATAVPRHLRERSAEHVAAVRLAPVIPARAAEPRRTASRQIAGFQILQAPPDVPVGVPPIDLTKAATKEEDFTGRLVPGGVADLGLAPLPPMRAEPIDGELADRSPYLVPGQMGPPYPEELRDDRPDGLVVVRFVIDTLGRVEVPSLHVVEATHPLFAQAVRSALNRLRYVPASRAGRPVRVRMEQRFEFHLAAP